jgi:tRNA uridine 5-carboxymethylaminomethyl modification enzyme
VFTSRAENRLALRYDNADERLEPYGRDLGLVGNRDWERFGCRRERISKLSNVIEKTRLRRTDPAYAALSSSLSVDLGDSITLAQLAKRPGVSGDLILSLLPREMTSDLTRCDLDTVLANSLYSGYLEVQRASNARLRQHDGLQIPAGFRFREVSGLSHEMVERLERAKPLTFGDVRRIRGVTVGALSTLLVHLTIYERAA